MPVSSRPRSASCPATRMACLEIMISRDYLWCLIWLRAWGAYKDIRIHSFHHTPRAHVHACIHTCIHALAHTHTHTHTHACMHAHTHAHICTHTITHSHAHTHTHTHTHTHMPHICPHMHVRTHTHTHTHTRNTCITGNGLVDSEETKQQISMQKRRDGFPVLT